MLINDVIEMLMAIPRTLAYGWVAWFALGLGLSIWSRRAKLGPYAYDEPAPAPAPRQKSGPRPSATPVAKSVPHSTGDAFGDLEQIFNTVQEGSHRLPGEAAAAAPGVSGPARNAPVLAAPQSLP
jgi:hypothetical protein